MNTTKLSPAALKALLVPFLPTSHYPDEETRNIKKNDSVFNCARILGEVNDFPRVKKFLEEEAAYVIADRA